MPLIVTHGWPGSIIEQLKIIDPLTNPTAHGASASDAFHVVIPSMPGYGFSGKPTEPGWDPARIARAWVELMKRLGYTPFVGAGGDWGGIVVDLMAVNRRLRGVDRHPHQLPRCCSARRRSGDPVRRPAAVRSLRPRTAPLREAERSDADVAYALEMAAHPQTLYGMADSPVALAAWMIDHDATSYGR